MIRPPRLRSAPAPIGQVLAAVLVAFAAVAASAGEWPQILGPKRNGQAEVEQIGAWPAAGPRQIWRATVGEGYAGPAVAGGRVLLFDRSADKDRVRAFDPDTGKVVWSAEFAAAYRGGIDADTGPRCVPVAHDGRLFLLSAGGDLHAVSLNLGKPLWTRNLYADYGAPDGYFGAGSTPIVQGDRLLVNVGGRETSGIVALAVDTGRTVWNATDEQASYSSPTAADVANERHVVFVTRYNVVSVDPASGKVRFRFPFGKRGPTVNAATPLVFGDRLFVTASYGVGAALAQIGPAGAKTLWANDETLSSQYNTPVYFEGHLYGIHGREDIGPAALRCVEAASGKVKWEEAGFGVAHIILADGKMLILKNDGELVLAEPSPDRFRKLAAARVGDGVTRALPALSVGRLYFRSNEGGGGSLVCLNVRPDER
jgi:outer membrane protein assembly factor BamB